MYPFLQQIGTDITGKLYTGRKIHLNCSLVAMETLLDLTLMGKVASNNYTHVNSVITNIFLLARVKIIDHIEKKSRDELTIKGFLISNGYCK